MKVPNIFQFISTPDLTSWDCVRVTAQIRLGQVGQAIQLKIRPHSVLVKFEVEFRVGELDPLLLCSVHLNEKWLRYKRFSVQIFCSTAWNTAVLRCRDTVLTLHLSLSKVKTVNLQQTRISCGAAEPNVLQFCMMTLYAERTALT